jgi:hypothetical protein
MVIRLLLIPVVADGLKHYSRFKHNAGHAVVVVQNKVQNLSVHNVSSP